MGRSSEAKDRKNPKKVKCDGPTDRRKDGPTDGPTKRVVESRSTRLKNISCSHLRNILEDEIDEGEECDGQLENRIVDSMLQRLHQQQVPGHVAEAKQMQDDEEDLDRNRLRLLD